MQAPPVFCSNLFVNVVSGIVSRPARFVYIRKKPGKMTTYRPTQIYASFAAQPPAMAASPTRKQSKPEETVLKSSPTKSNEIQVCATGELSLTPDRCRLTISLSSTKDLVADAKNSVSRRIDYILQTLHNHQVKESDIHVSKVLRRVDGLFHMEAEITASFLDFHKCQSVGNILVEKLDESVRVSSPEFFHSPHRLENLRKQASLIAVHNAKQKAVEIAQFLHANVGQAIAIREEYSNEWEGPPESHDPDTPMTMQQRLEQLTVNVVVKVSASFEMKSRTKKKEAKQ